MNKASVIVLALLFVIPVAKADAPAPMNFHVAPSGDDRAAGTEAAPFATLTRARDAVRELKTHDGGALKEPVDVIVHGGNYFLTEPLLLGPEDSGTELSAVTYTRRAGETPILDGGRRIENWKKSTLNGQAVWAAEVPQIKAGTWPFRVLWVNDRRAVLARFPAKGYLMVQAPLDKGIWNTGVSRFQYRASDLEPVIGVQGAELVGFNRWVEFHVPVESIDGKEHIISFGGRTQFMPEADDPYFLEGAAQFLTQPGQWWLDGDKGIVYYMPLADEDMKRAVVVAPLCDQVIRLAGTPHDGKMVEHIVFSGLTCAHTHWIDQKAADAGVGGSKQAAVHVDAAISAAGARYRAFENCTIAHINNYAIELGRGCSENRISRCELFDLGAGGIKIGEPTIRPDKSDHTFANEVADCTLHDGGMFFDSAVGIWIGQSYDNRILHNDIHDFHYTGISIGWTWGYSTAALGTGNLVEGNLIHHIGLRDGETDPLLSDMGGIYTLGLQTGTIIRGNVFHDIVGRKYGGWGIYFDEGTTNILATNNLVYRTTHGGFHQNYGQDNRVTNNIFAFGRDWQVERTRLETHTSFTFDHNIVYWSTGSLLRGNWSKIEAAFDRNIYWCATGVESKFAAFTLDDWRKQGQDVNSLVADPLFVDPAHDNFRLKDGSPAAKVGFAAFDVSTVGPRK